MVRIGTQELGARSVDNSPVYNLPKPLHFPFVSLSAQLADLGNRKQWDSVGERTREKGIAWIPSLYNVFTMKAARRVNWRYCFVNGSRSA